MKLFFIASTCYTLYLMKYQYRLVYVPASPFLIAANLVCPRKSDKWSSHWYLQNRISRRPVLYTLPHLQLPVLLRRDSVVVFYFPRICRYSTSTLHASTDRGGRDNYNALFGRAWCLQSPLYSQLDLPVRRYRVPEYHNSDSSSCVAYSSYFSEGTVDPIAVTAGLVQIGLYVDFFYVYFGKYVSLLSITYCRC